MNYSKNISLLKSIDNDLNRKKIIFNARLTDGTNEYLPRADYFTSPIDFYWQNDKDVPVYIVKYRFIYVEASEPGPTEMYHTIGNYTSNIGAMNEAGDDYEAPYITIEDNRDYYNPVQPNYNKQSWTNSAGWCFEKDFSHAPIEIGVSRKFGHHIPIDIDTGDYDTDPIGIIDGYYYTD